MEDTQKSEQKTLPLLELKLREIRNYRLAIKSEMDLIERARKRIKDLQEKQDQLEQYAQSLAQYNIPLDTPHG